MSKGLNALHSHSLLERELEMPKHQVLVDVEYQSVFVDIDTKPFRYGGVDYLKVPTYIFAKRGGMFKALLQ